VKLIPLPRRARQGKQKRREDGGSDDANPHRAFFISSCLSSAGIHLCLFSRRLLATSSAVNSLLHSSTSPSTSSIARLPPTSAPTPPALLLNSFPASLAPTPGKHLPSSSTSATSTSALSWRVGRGARGRRGPTRRSRATPLCTGGPVFSLVRSRTPARRCVSSAPSSRSLLTTFLSHRSSNTRTSSSRFFRL
jgi:hypothetical protein